MRGSTRSEDSHSHGVREQDEEEEQVSGEWRRTRYRHSIGFLGHGQLSHPIACSARATSVSLGARPVSLCIAAAAAARVICACVRREREYVCVRARTAISREQGPNKLSLIPTPLAGTDTKCSESRAHARARTLSASACLTMPPCLPVSLFLSLSLVEAVGFVKSTDRTWKGK